MGAIEKVTKVATTAGAIAALVKVTRTEASSEIQAVTFAGVPLFKRDAQGRPSILGIPFRRWRK